MMASMRSSQFERLRMTVRTSSSIAEPNEEAEESSHGKTGRRTFDVTHGMKPPKRRKKNRWRRMYAR